MVNPNYNSINYRNAPTNFYVDSQTMKYQIQKFESENLGKYRPKSTWDELMDMQISAYEDYQDGKKKKRKRIFN